MWFNGFSILMNVHKSYVIVLFNIAVVVAIGMTSFLEKCHVVFFDVSHTFSVQLRAELYHDYNYSVEPSLIIKPHTSTTKDYSFPTSIVAPRHYLSALDFVCRKINSVYVHIFSLLDDLLMTESRIGYLLMGVLVLIAIKVAFFKRIRLSIQRFIFDFSHLQFYRQHSRSIFPPVCN